MKQLTVASDAGAKAGALAARLIRQAIAERGTARVIFASAPSQERLLAVLAGDASIDWSRVTSFHMDEYLGLAVEHRQAFGQWLSDRLPKDAHSGLMRIDAGADVGDEARRYTELLTAAPVDLTCLGVGVNGHVAFNEPGSVDFNDEETMRVVNLDPKSRLQQVEEGLFPGLSDVPTRALTLTFSAVTRARALICTVLGEHKAEAVAGALDGPVSTSCPASGLQSLRGVSWFLDEPAASMLQGRTRVPA